MSADMIVVHRGEWEISAYLVGRKIMIVVLNLETGRLALTSDPYPIRWRTKSIPVRPVDILDRLSHEAVLNTKAAFIIFYRGYMPAPIFLGS